MVLPNPARPDELDQSLVSFRNNSGGKIRRNLPVSVSPGNLNTKIYKEFPSVRAFSHEYHAARSNSHSGIPDANFAAFDLATFQSRQSCVCLRLLNSHKTLVIKQIYLANRFAGNTSLPR